MSRTAAVLLIAGSFVLSGCCKKALSAPDRKLQQSYSMFTSESFAQALESRGLELYSPRIVTSTDDGSMGEPATRSPMESEDGEEGDGGEDPEALPENELLVETYSEVERSPSYEFVRHKKTGQIFRLNRRPRRIVDKRVKVCGCAPDPWGKGITPGTFEVTYHVPNFGGAIEVVYDEKMLSTPHAGGRCDRGAPLP